MRAVSRKASCLPVPCRHHSGRALQGPPGALQGQQHDSLGGRPAALRSPSLSLPFSPIPHPAAAPQLLPAPRDLLVPKRDNRRKKKKRKRRSRRQKQRTEPLPDHPALTSATAPTQFSGRHFLPTPCRPAACPAAHAGTCSSNGAALRHGRAE